MATSFFEKMEKLDRRWIYLMVFVALSIPFFIPIPLPIAIRQEVKALHEKIEDIAQENAKDPDNAKIVLISISWSANVQAEGWPQTEAIMEHCLHVGVPFAIFSMAQPECPQFGELCIKDIRKRWDKLNKENEAALAAGKPSIFEDEQYTSLKRRIDRLGDRWNSIEYSIDYCNWGYKYLDIAALTGMVTSLYTIVPEDFKGTPLQELKMMKTVRSMNDLAVIVEITGSSTLPTWLGWIAPSVDGEFAYACTGVMAAEAYPFLKSRQIIALLSGMDGAAQYEKLIGIKARGRKGMESQNLAHLWIILMVVLGNVGFYYSRRKNQ